MQRELAELAALRLEAQATLERAGSRGASWRRSQSTGGGLSTRGSMIDTGGGAGIGGMSMMRASMSAVGGQSVRVSTSGRMSTGHDYMLQPEGGEAQDPLGALRSLAPSPPRPTQGQGQGHAAGVGEGPAVTHQAHLAHLHQVIWMQSNDAEAGQAKGTPPGGPGGHASGASPPRGGGSVPAAVAAGRGGPLESHRQSSMAGKGGGTAKRKAGGGRAAVYWSADKAGAEAG